MDDGGCLCIGELLSYLDINRLRATCDSTADHDDYDGTYTEHDFLCDM